MPTHESTPPGPRRASRGRPVSPSGTPPPQLQGASTLPLAALEQREAARLAVNLARDQLAEQLAAVDSDDVKALGFLAVEVAAMAALFATRTSLDGLWWLPCSGFGLAAVLLMTALGRRRFRPGKEPLGIYFSDTLTPALDLVLALRAARLQIVQVRGSKSRRLPYTLSLVLLVLSLVGGGLTLVGVH